MIGQTVSHYKITEKLGEGGMGVVYKAEDTKLERTVALKFLAAHLLNDDEAKARFLREAKAAAALSHPNICHVYEIDEAAGRTFISMEFVQGETLEDRIAKGPLSLKDALDIGRQVADGLEAAHEKGIVHRDIKPANILLDAKGRATIMDFGLARLTEASRLTKADTTMGTVAYMSPEQVQGMEVDHRSDIWALGCVLYEMVCGQKPFKGVYDKALLYEIVHQEPEPLTGLRTGVPMELEFIVGKCLAKDASDRYQSAREIPVDLRTLSEKLKSGRSTILSAANISDTAAAPNQPPSSARALAPDSVVISRKSQRTLQALTAVATVGMLVFAILFFTQVSSRKAPAPVTRFSLDTPPGLDVSSGSAGPVISPNGRHVAYTTTGSESVLWVQDLDQKEPRQLAGTEGAILPFWSPDSEFIGFAADEQLKKISVHGGPVGLICALPNPILRQGSWSPDGESIIFAAGGGGKPGNIYQVPAQGGAPNSLIMWEEFTPTGAVSRPHFLPAEAGRAVLFTVGRSDSSRIFVQDLKTGRRVELGPGDRPVYSATGHIVYHSDRGVYDLWALPFSLKTLSASGSAFPLKQAARQPSISADGETLVYLDGADAMGHRLVWVDRAGEVLPEEGEFNLLTGQPAISPDGRSVAYIENFDIWVQDLSRGSRVRLSDGSGSTERPVWSPDGSQLAFSGPPFGNASVFLRNADGSGESAPLDIAQEDARASDWPRPDLIVLTVRSRETFADIWLVERGGDGGWRPRPFLRTPAREGNARVSPNGRYIAYVSDESGQDEVYVQPFPEEGRRTVISTNGGDSPRWSRDGDEIFYLEGDTLVAVAIDAGSEFSVSKTSPLFAISPWVFPGHPDYDVSPDGKRFLVRRPRQRAEAETEIKIRVVQNWYEEFRGRERN